MSQLAINTHHVVQGAALTVSGPVHIGLKILTPIFPSNEAYDDALLWVEKGIVTEDLTFAYNSEWDSWPDYVFKEDYELMDLSALEQFIKKEKHLPGIASVEEIKQRGIRTKNTIIDLLTKIEELTLYTIAQEKKIKEQEQLNLDLLKRLSAIERRLNN